MKDELFSELVESIEAAGAYLRGEDDGVRVTFVGEPDPRSTRDQLGLSEDRFAAMLGISIRTLRNWERGRRELSGPAVRLLQIVGGKRRLPPPSIRG